MGWKETDERLIKRGELILDLSFLENYEQELETLNKGKVGPPYLLTPNYIQLLTTIRYLYRMPYRQLEEFTRSLHKLVPKLPSADYSGLRKRILALSPDPYQSLDEKEEPISIAVDSTGVKVNRAGGSRSGDIIAKGTYYKASWGHDLYQQVVYDNAIEGGDSGGPVYTESWSSGQYNVKAYGINWGRWVDLDRTVFSPMSGIESDLGSAFDVTG